MTEDSLSSLLQSSWYSILRENDHKRSRLNELAGMVNGKVVNELGEVIE